MLCDIPGEPEYSPDPVTHNLAGCAYLCTINNTAGRPSVRCGCGKPAEGDNPSCPPFKCVHERPRVNGGPGPGSNQEGSKKETKTSEQSVRQRRDIIERPAASVRTKTGKAVIPTVDEERDEVERSAQHPPVESDEREEPSLDDVAGTADSKRQSTEEPQRSSAAPWSTNEESSYRGSFARQLEEHSDKCVCTCLVNLTCTCPDLTGEQSDCRAWSKWSCRPTTVNKTGTRLRVYLRLLLLI